MPPIKTMRSTAVGAAALAAVLALSACSGAASTPSTSSDVTSIRLQTSWVPNIEFGGSYLAEAEGHNKAERVKVTILAGGADLDPTTVVAAGKADIGIAEPDNVARANANGADLVVIGATFQKNPLAILSLASNPIAKPKDMYGKTIAVPAIDQPQHDALVALNKLDASKITTVPAQFDVTPLTSHQADGLYVYATEQPVALEQQGIKGTTMLLADYGELRYGDSYFTTRSYLDAHHDAVVRFMAAQQAGWEDYVKDQSKAVSLAVNRYGKGAGLVASVEAEQGRLQVPLIQTGYTKKHGLLSMSPSSIKQNVATIKTMGVKGASSSLFDTRILDEVESGSK